MKILRWTIYGLVSLLGAPIIIESLSPKHSYYSWKLFWYSIQGLAPLFLTFFFIAMLQTLVLVIIAPSKGRKMANISAICALFIGIGSSPISGEGLFLAIKVLGCISGVLLGWQFGNRPTIQRLWA